MKPFNLEAALAGAPVVTRDGKPVQELHLFKSTAPIQSLFGVIDGRVNSFTPSTGRYYDDGEEHDKDLFMASTRETGWINIYPRRPRTLNPSVSNEIHPTKEAADKVASQNRIACIEISWEE